jgi:hypothetical protein
MSYLRRFIPERLLTWHQGHQLNELCMAYGGRFSDDETRVCGLRRGHLYSHAYDRIDEVLASRGWCERDGVLVQLERVKP